MVHLLFALGLVALAGCTFDRSGLAASDRPTAATDAAVFDLLRPDAALLDRGPAPDIGDATDLPRPDRLQAADVTPATDVTPAPDVTPPPPPDKDKDGVLDVDDPCPSVANPLLLDDDFVNSVGWASYSGSWSLDSGDFYQKTLGSYCQGQHVYRAGLSEPDLYIEVAVTRVTGSTSGADCNLMGVTARSKLPSSKTYQFCGVTPKGCSGSCNTAPVGMYGYGWQGGYLPAGAQTKATPAVSGSFDGPYHLRMVVRGNQVHCWLAGDKSTEIVWSADGLGAGTVGLFTETATARFHHLRLFSIPAGCQ